LDALKNAEEKKVSINKKYLEENSPNYFKNWQVKKQNIKTEIDENEEENDAVFDLEDELDKVNNEFNFQVIFPFDPPQALDFGSPSLIESGYNFSPTSVTVLNSGKYLLNYDATVEQDPCGNPIVEMSISRNGYTEISSVVSGTIGTGGCFDSTSFARTLFLVLNAGDVLSLQIGWAGGPPDLSIVTSNNFSIVKM
jgi:hypothetical protein